MSRGRSGIGTELVPLVLILATLAGSLGLVITIHRRFVTRTKVEKPVVAVVGPAPQVKPPPQALPESRVEVEEPEAPAPPAPEDPTPKVLAKLVASEADQLLEASKADRKAGALEVARKAALAESERWRRRESLVRLQLDSLETKVHQLETTADEMALERDALEKEIDARKALAAQARSRPGTAILPHRGQNGTWRRPIVIECVNGMAILRPQGISFGLLELAMGFGPSTNPFVATVAREAIRIQGNVSPDGQVVTPYIFFLVRPDGIRTYYEARGRLEPLGITFGYELADQDWEIDFPDLDDVKTWDGSGPTPPSRPDPLARTRSRPPGSSAAEEESLPNLGGLPGSSDSQARPETSRGEFNWPPRTRGVPQGRERVSLGGTGSGSGSGPGGIGNPGEPRDAGPSESSGSTAQPRGLARGDSPISGASRSGGNGIRFPGGTSGVRTSEPLSTVPGRSELGSLIPPRELALGGPITPLPPSTSGSEEASAPLDNPGLKGLAGRPTPTPTPNPGNLLQGSTPSASTSNANGSRSPLPPVVSPRTAPARGLDALTNPAQPGRGSGSDPIDPANTDVVPSGGISGEPGEGPRTPGRSMTSSSSISPDQTPPIRHIGPFSKPLAAGLDPNLIANASSPAGASAPSDENDPTQPESLNPGQASGPSGTANTAPTLGSSNLSKNPTANPGTGTPPSRVIGPGDASNSTPPSGSPPLPLAVGMGSPGSTPPTEPPPSASKPSSTPPLPINDNFKITGKYEIVVVCNQRGVIVQPGAYRVTTDALKNREGLLKNQIVALVKARRTAEPKLLIEPRVRFLVQPGGESTYWTARGQFLLSGLDWPITTQIAERDHLTFLPSESW